MIGGLELFIDLHISINNVCMLFSWRFDELSFNSRSSKFATFISYVRRRVRLCILFILFIYFWLFEILLQNIKGHYWNADIIQASYKYFVLTIAIFILVKALNLLFVRLHILAMCFVKVNFSSMVFLRSFTSHLHFICLFSIANLILLLSILMQQASETCQDLLPCY